MRTEEQEAARRGKKGVRGLPAYHNNLSGHHRTRKSRLQGKKEEAARRGKKGVRWIFGIVDTSRRVLPTASE